MTTSLSWIKAYVPELEVEPQEYMDAMTLSGSKVEGYKKLRLPDLLQNEQPRMQQMTPALHLLIVLQRIPEGLQAYHPLQAP